MGSYNIHLHWWSPRCSPASSMLLFDVESAIILQVAIRNGTPREDMISFLTVRDRFGKRNEQNNLNW